MSALHSSAVFRDLVHVNDERWGMRAGKRQPTLHIPIFKDLIHHEPRNLPRFR